MLPDKVTGQLFIRDPESLEGFKPEFTEYEIGQLSQVRHETYTVFGSFDDEPNGHRYSVTVRGIGTATISMVNSQFYGDGIELLNQYKKENPNSDIAKWLNANAQKLNAAIYYWSAVNSRKKAELLLLKANLAACDAKNFAAGKNALTAEERNLIITEYGYDPKECYGL